MALAAQGDPPAATADMAGLTGLYRALQANERALQDGSYDSGAGARRHLLPGTAQLA